MKKQKLYDAITNISDKNITDAKKHRFKRRRALWLSAVACVLIAVICIPMFSGNDPVEVDKYGFSGFRLVAAAAEAPDADWTTTAGVPDNLRDFFTGSTVTLLSDSDENVLYSPVGAYLNLAMLAECADSDSRQQILDSLGSVTLEQNRQQAMDIYNTVCDVSENPPASSLWLPGNYSYNRDTLSQLESRYYTSVFEGGYGTPEMLEGLKKWMNDSTGNELSEAVDGFELKENSELLLLNTLCFEGEWEKAFSTTASRVFYAPQGEVHTEYMIERFSDLRCKKADGFTAFTLDFKDGGKMTFMLPDRGSSVAGMAKTDGFAAAATNADYCDTVSMCSLFLPGFDITCRTDMTDAAMALGITDAFDPGKSDITALSDGLEGAWIGRFEQYVNVKIDEKGAKASSVTITEGQTKGDPIGPEKIVVDRPFAFTIFNSADMPLFSGVVNDPTK